MELYIHIPFCIRKCSYCDFLSGPAEKKTQEEYMKRLLRETALAGVMHSTRMRERDIDQNTEVVDTVFIGGGTPSAVDAVWIVRLMEQVRTSFSLAKGAEITMEANPGTLTREKLAQYRQAGINRLSIGLQSTDNGELQCLGRIHTYEEFLENYRLAREAGFANINIDLMSALPGQTVASYENTLRRIIALKPEHISAYSLIIEEGTPFWERYGHGEGIPDEEEDRRMYHLTKAILAQAGYERYEISNYAKSGYQCRHNVGYWTRVPYLGLGLGAASFYGGQRFANTRDMEEYLDVLRQETTSEEEKERLQGAGGDEILAALHRDIQTLTRQDAMEEFMFLGLRLTAGVSAAEFATLFGQSIEEIYGPVLQKMQRQGLMESEDGCWHLTDRGLDVSNLVLAEFLL